MSRRKRQTQFTPEPGWAIYLRTSDEEAQDPANSQRRQREAIERSLIAASSRPVFGEYIDNLSGRYAHNRPQYQLLLADARAGRFSHVAVENAERFGRNDTEALRAIDELDELGIAIRFADYPDLDPVDPDDRILVSLSFTLARRESLKLGQRVRGGIHAKLRNGGAGGLAPDGYVNRERRTDQHDRLEYGKYTRWVEIDKERAPLWRAAWDMLLEDKYTLEQICEELHQRGFRYRRGRAFVELTPTGRVKHNVSTLSRIFHNWFYAGWVVSESAGIPPKTVKGNWTPIVTTEEFERGLVILIKRDQHHAPNRKHQYLLKGLLYVQLDGSDRLVRLTCSTTNAHRPGGGTRYYCIPRSRLNISCEKVDRQVARRLHRIQVDPALQPVIRAIYTADLAARLGHNRPNERQQTEEALKAVADEEARAARLFAAGKISEDVWDKLWAEWQDRRRRLQQALAVVSRETEVHIANLDEALEIITRIGLLYNGLERSDQHELLRLMVEKVVVDTEGKVIRFKLLPPFAYLNRVTQRARHRVRTGRGNEEASAKAGRRSKRSDQFLSGGPEG